MMGVSLCWAVHAHLRLGGLCPCVTKGEWSHCLLKDDRTFRKVIHKVGEAQVIHQDARHILLDTQPGVPIFLQHIFTVSLWCEKPCHACALTIVACVSSVHATLHTSTALRVTLNRACKVLSDSKQLNCVYVLTV
jgi:hypothetical protein